MPARDALVTAAAAIVATDGPAALSARRLAREAGTSTMAVYTHFGAMGDVRAAVRAAGFDRLSAAWGSVEHSDDPVADVMVAAAQYVRFALAEQHLFRATFLETPPGSGSWLDVSEAPRVLVQRCLDTGRFRRADPDDVAWQLWLPLHGLACAVLAGVLPWDDLLRRVCDSGLAVVVGLGDDLAAADVSLDRAIARLGLSRPSAR